MTAVSATTVNGITCDLRTAWTFEDGELPPDRVEVVGVRGSVELIVGHTLRVYAGGYRTDYPPAKADLCGTNTIIFWHASATGHRHQRSVLPRRSPG